MLAEVLTQFGLTGGLAVVIEYIVTALAIYKIVEVFQSVVKKK